MIIFGAVIGVNLFFIVVWGHSIGKVYWVKYGQKFIKKFKKETLKTSERDMIEEFKSHINKDLESSKINIDAEETKIMI